PRRTHTDGSNDYGLRLVIDIPLTSGQSGTDNSGQTADTSNQVANAAAPQNSNGSTPIAIDLCMGTWLTGEDATNNWVVRSSGESAGSTPEPGLSIFALHRDSDNNLSFVPSFEMISAGFNIEGTPTAPLFNLNGYTLKGTELRANLGWSTSGWSYGAALRLDNLGFPLGPSFGSAVQ